MKNVRLYYKLAYIESKNYQNIYNTVYRINELLYIQIIAFYFRFFAYYKNIYIHFSFAPLALEKLFPFINIYIYVFIFNHSHIHPFQYQPISLPPINPHSYFHFMFIVIQYFVILLINLHLPFSRTAPSLLFCCQQNSFSHHI